MVLPDFSRREFGTRRGVRHAEQAVGIGEFFTSLSGMAHMATRSLIPMFGMPNIRQRACGSLTGQSEGLDMLDRITVNPEICGGRPTIRGMRITVDFVLKLLGDGYNAEEIVGLYPELEKEDVYQAAKYGAWLASERTSPVE